MKTKLHIISLGTSILNNFDTRNPAPSKLKTPLAFLASDPAFASAEINSLDARTGFLTSSKIAKSLTISLVYSSTAKGKKVATILRKFLKDKVAGVNTIPFTGFERAADTAYEPAMAQTMAEESLADLQTKIQRHIKKMRSVHDEIQLNITGGFKAESAIIYRVGLDQKLPVYYRHESFQRCIELPQ
jgi:putative CRISPR-associated protein (TIGR02619 family)